MRKSFKKILPFLLILALLAGCSARSPKAERNGYAAVKQKTSSSVPAEYGLAAGAADMGYDMYYETAEEAAVNGVEAPAAAPEPGAISAFPANRKIIRNADLSLQTREYDTFITELESRITSNGGYIESSYANGNSYSSRRNLRSVNLTARIPAEKLDSFLNGVCAMGNVLNKSVYSNDVTASYVDTEARLKALRTERDTLMGLLEKAEKTEDVIAIYERISEVTYEIESYESRMRTFDDQIAYSTVHLFVEEVERETVVVEETAWQEIARRLGENLQDIGEGCREFFVAFVSVLPSLVLAALIILVLFIIVRAIVRKSRKKAEQKK